MKTLACVWFVFAMLVSAADAQVAYKLPTTYQVAGRICGNGYEQYSVTGVDPATSNYTGQVFAYTRCGLSGRGGGYQSIYYAGCASAVWDAVGNLVSYTVEWRTSGRTLVPASSCLA
jgi:hypothetical protein